MERIQVVCGWCSGSVGSSGQCERDCENRRVVDSMTCEERIEIMRRDSETGMIE